MGMPDRVGFFDAAIEGVGVCMSKDKLQVSVAIQLLAMKNPSPTPADGEPEWYGVHEQDWHITSYQFLQKNDGSVNEIGLDMIKRVFPDWDGSDFEALNNWDTSGMTCRATLEVDNYGGTPKIRVKSLHDPNFTGGSGVKKADAVEIKGINAKFGSTFRALAAPPKPAASANGAPRPGLPPAKPTLPMIPYTAPTQPAEPEAPPSEEKDDLPF